MGNDVLSESIKNSIMIYNSDILFELFKGDETSYKLFRNIERSNEPTHFIPSISLVRFGFYDDFTKTGELLDLLWKMHGFSTIPYCVTKNREKLNELFLSYYPENISENLTRYLSRVKNYFGERNFDEIKEFVERNKLTKKLTLDEIRTLVFPKEDKLIELIRNKEISTNENLIIPQIKDKEHELRRKAILPPQQSREMASVTFYRDLISDSNLREKFMKDNF